MKRFVKMFLGLLTLSVLLAACGASIEKNIVGGWKLAYEDEVESYLEFTEERMFLRTILYADPESAEYILTETQNDNFIIEVIDPSDGGIEFLFEGYFENKDTIKLDENFEEIFELIRVDNIAEDIAKEKKRAEAKAEKERSRAEKENAKEEAEREEEIEEEEKKCK